MQHHHHHPQKALLSSRGERSLVVAGRAAHGPADQWQDYQPCTCEGRCKADCPCVAARNFCEKFCACSAACKERCGLEGGGGGR